MITIKQNNSINAISGFTKNFDSRVAANVHTFHKTVPGYRPTPLYQLDGLSAKLHVYKIWIKNESFRFGLNAFKVLGASYAAAKLLGEMFELHEENISFLIFQNPTIRDKLKGITLVTATDGNHGRGVAWTAQQLGCKCIVYMPKGSSQSRLNNIKSHGAEASIVDGNYDEAVSLAKINSEKYGWLLIQDTAWYGYEKIPLWIMQGYLTMMDEISEQLTGEIPTHVFIQSGVGSLPAAVLAYCIEKFRNDKPIFTVVEPGDAACVYESYSKQTISTLTNEMNTIMAGLACGTPSLLAWDILKNHSDYFAKCSDDVTIKGMQILGRQEFGDVKIISGESGAVTTGLIYYLLSEPQNKKHADMLRLNKDSKILLISTEGDTDPETYKKTISQ